jgi:hypothetical protein
MVERKRKDVEQRDAEASAGRSGTPPAGDAAALLLDSQVSAGNQSASRLARALAARKAGPAGGGRGIVADFSAVDVRLAPEADSMGALAYARGTEIHFAPGAFDPNNAQGMAQIGHELAHVVQQRAGRVDPQLGPEDDAPGGAAMPS